MTRQRRLAPTEDDAYATVQPIAEKYTKLSYEYWRSAQDIESGSGWQCWLAEACENMDQQGYNPWFRRVDDGLSEPVDFSERFKTLGNAVVSQVAEYIGRRIMRRDRRR